jgi:hypothetical protein
VLLLSFSLVLCCHYGPGVRLEGIGLRPISFAAGRHHFTNATR